MASFVTNNIVEAYKQEGESWKNALDRAREELKISSEIKLSILGRLDEMAEGLILIGADLTAEEKNKYIGLEKEYEWSLLLGASTDTYDILGLVESAWDLGELPHGFEEVCVNPEKEFVLPYPAFSSKNVGGEPLWKLTREGEEFEAPTKEMKIMAHELLETRKISSKELLPQILERIEKVQGDFRQEEIAKSWQNALKNECNFYIVDFRTKVSSGTYIRALANAWGKKLGCGGIAWSIKRTKVGDIYQI